jgi:hypothetical protein
VLRNVLLSHVISLLWVVNMKRFTLYFSVSLLAHVIGISGVLLANFLSTAIVIPQNFPEVSEELNVTPIATLDTTSLHSLPKFMPTGRGCGNGYSQGYSTPDGQRMNEGVQVFNTTRMARTELSKWIANATRIVERIQNHKNRWGDFGERIVIVNPPNENGADSVSILWYGRDNSVSYIDAPTLDLALEFERTNAYAY